MMRALFQRLFPPRDVRETVSYIRNFVKEHATFSRDIVEREAVRLAKQSNKTVTFVSKEFHHPEHLALLLITNVIGKEISGRKYKRDQKLMARDMLQLWDRATRDMREKNYYSQREYERDCDWINKRCTWLRHTNVPSQDD